MASVTRSLTSASWRTHFAAAPQPTGTRRGWHAIAGYGLGLAACVAVLAVVFVPWEQDFRIPYVYHGDALYLVAAIKGIVENGWYLANPHLGAPFGHDVCDYPMADAVHWGCLKLLSCFSSEPGTIFNLYYLASFPLTMLASLVALRRFAVSFPSAIVAALLYTFLPWHFLRIEHLFLACYYLVPLMLMVVLEVYLGLAGRNKVPDAVLRGVICLLVGGSGVYYAFFGCFLLVVAGVARWVRVRQWRELRIPAFLIALIAFSGLANVMPNLVYRWQHGSNSTIVRYASEAEIFGLRLTQLVLPEVHHRFPPFAELARNYKLGLGGGTNESEMAALGLVGAAGFLGVVSVALFGRRRRQGGSRLVHAVGALCLAGFLLGTVSGVGALFNLVFTSYIRAYNRIAIYLAFLALFAVALFLDSIRRRWAANSNRAFWFHIGVGALAVVGILDQTNQHCRAERGRWQADFHEDEAFVSELEARAPTGAMIYQMPYVAFPEASPRGELMDYDLLRPYLHSQRLCWSYGAMKGRPADAWHHRLAQQPILEQVTTMAEAGFAGIVIDRAGYDDGGKAVEADLANRLGEPAIISTGERFAYFDLSRGLTAPNR